MSYAVVAWTPERRRALGIDAADLSPATFETVFGEVLGRNAQSVRESWAAEDVHWQGLEPAVCDAFARAFNEIDLRRQSEAQPDAEPVDFAEQLESLETPHVNPYVARGKRFGSHERWFHEAGTFDTPRRQSAGSDLEPLDLARESLRDLGDDDEAALALDPFPLPPPRRSPAASKTSAEEAAASPAITPPKRRGDDDTRRAVPREAARGGDDTRRAVPPEAARGGDGTRAAGAGATRALLPELEAEAETALRGARDAAAPDQARAPRTHARGSLLAPALPPPPPTAESPAPAVAPPAPNDAEPRRLRRSERAPQPRRKAPRGSTHVGRGMGRDPDAEGRLRGPPAGLGVGARVTLRATGHGAPESLKLGRAGIVVFEPEGPGGWWKVRLDGEDDDSELHSAQACNLTVLVAAPTSEPVEREESIPLPAPKRSRRS